MRFICLKILSAWVISVIWNFDARVNLHIYLLENECDHAWEMILKRTLKATSATKLFFVIK